MQTKEEFLQPSEAEKQKLGIFGLATNKMFKKELLHLRITRNF